MPNRVAIKGLAFDFSKGEVYDDELPKDKEKIAMVPGGRRREAPLAQIPNRSVQSLSVSLVKVRLVSLM